MGNLLTGGDKVERKPSELFNGRKPSKSRESGSLTRPIAYRSRRRTVGLFGGTSSANPLSDQANKGSGHLSPKGLSSSQFSYNSVLRL